MTAVYVPSQVSDIARLRRSIEANRHPVLSRPIVGDLTTMSDGSASAGGSGGTLTNGNYRVKVFLPNGARDLSPVFGNISGWADPTYNAKIRVACAYEPATGGNGIPTGVITPFKWPGSSGGKYIDLAPGALAAALPLGVNLPAGSYFWLRYNVQVGTGIGGNAGDGWPKHNLLFGGVLGTVDPTGTGYVEDTGTSGNCATTAVTFGNSASFGYGPLCVTGTPMALGNPGPKIAVLGDSISTGGYADTFISARKSWCSLAFGSKGFVSLSLSGQGVASFATLPNRMGLLAGGFTDFVCAWATNDIGNGMSLVAYKANCQVIADYCAWAGIRLWLCTSVPRTTSTDSFATVTNQTPVTNFEAGAGSLRGQINGWLYGTPGTDLKASLAAGAPALDFGGVIDMAAPVEVNSSNVLTRHGGFWKASTLTSSTLSFTEDGTHPGQAGHAGIAAAVPVASFV